MFTLKQEKICTILLPMVGHEHTERGALPHLWVRAELCVIFDLWFSSTRSDCDDAAVC